MDDSTVPIDATAEQAEALVKAAIAWAGEAAQERTLTREEWKLLEACQSYGDHYRGLRSA